MGPINVVCQENEFISFVVEAHAFVVHSNERELGIFMAVRLETLLQTAKPEDRRILLEFSYLLPMISF